MMMDNEPRMQDRSPEGQMFAIESEIKNMMKEYEVAVRSGDNQRAQMIADQIGKLEKIKIEIQSKFVSEEGDPMGMNLSMPSIYNYRLRKSLESGNIDDIKSEQKGIRNSAIRDMDMIQNSGMMQDDPNYAERMMQMLKGVRGNYAEGGESSTFPDLTGDGQVTQADILKGRGVEFAEGGEAIGDDLAGIAMSQEEAMAEVGNAEKEMAMIQQLVTVVQQLLAEGISEDDLVAFLKEQGLDDEDIDSLMQMVLQSQSTQAPDQIGQELQGMM